MQIVLSTSGVKFDDGDKPRQEREKGNSLTIIPENYSVIDIETTGLDPRFDEIIEIAAIKVRENKIIDKFQSLVKPSSYFIDYDDNDNEITFYVDEFITKLTGITNNMLEEAPIIDEVIPQFINFIKDDILVGHNVNFDINFLYDVVLEKENLKLQNDYVDLMRLARKVYPNFINHRLITIAANLGVNCDNHHRALADCIITFDSFTRLNEYVLNNSINLSILFNRNSKNKNIDLTALIAKTTDFEKDHILFNKYCTFTGKLDKLDRKDAAQLVVNLGGHCLNGVTKKTNFLILGNFDYNASIKDGKSTKLKKAEQLILEGHDLQILSENVFYELVTGE